MARELKLPKSDLPPEQKAKVKHGHSSEFWQDLRVRSGVVLTVTLAGWQASGGGGRSPEEADAFHLIDVGRTPGPQAQQE